MARETRYRVIYFDENDKEVYNEDFHTFNDMLVEGQPLTPPPHVKRTEVWMTHLLFSTPSPGCSPNYSSLDARSHRTDASFERD